MRTKINSLCMVRLKPDGISKQLVRLADLEDDVFVQIRRDEDGIDRNVIYYPTILDLPDKTIDIFSWEPFNDGVWKQRNIRQISKSWLEVLEMPVYSLQQLVDEIKEGVDWSDGSHDLLILYEKELALYWPKKQMHLLDGRQTYTSDTKAFCVYKLSEEDIKSCSSDVQPDNRKYYAKTDLGEVQEKVWVFSPEKVISTIITEHIKSFSGLSKRERQIVRKVLSDIDNATIIHEISHEFDCDFDTAQQYYDKYFQNVEAMLAIEAWDGALFQAMIDNNSRLSRRMLASVEDHWKTLHNDNVENFNQLWCEIESLKTVLTRQKEEIHQNEKSIDDLKNLESSIREKIKVRLDEARSDMGALISDYSWLLQTNKDANCIRQPFLVVPTIMHENQNEETENLELARYNLINNLSEAGVINDDLSTELAQFLITAYCNRVNLLIAGVGGFDITMALSAAICCAEPTILNPSDSVLQQDVYDSIAGCDAQILVIPNALETESFDRIISITEQFPEKMFIFLTPFSQSLAMEPRGLYQYMLPLFTDFFISGVANRDYIYENAEQAIKKFSISQKEIKKARAEIARISSAIFLEKRQETIISTVKASLEQIFKDVNSYQVCFRALWMPIAICLNKAEELLDEIRTGMPLEEEAVKELEKYIERKL